MLRASHSRGGGTGGRETGRKGGGRCTGGGRRGGGKRDSQGSGKREKKGKITQHCAIFRNRINSKGREPKNTGREPGLKGTGSGRFKPPCPPPQVKGLGKNIETSFLRTARSLGTVESFCLRTQQQWKNEVVFFLERESILQGILTYVMLAPWIIYWIINYLALHFALTACCQSL